MNEITLLQIDQTTQGSLDGTLSFPQVVARLLDVGVEFYHVDFLRSEKTVYLQTGESHVSPISLPLDPIAKDFDAAEVAADVRASQTENQPYPEFVSRARKVGCIGYFAYLAGKRVVYNGRYGDQLVEYFPS